MDAARLLGERDAISTVLLEIIEELFCRLYGFKQETNINECRYSVLERRSKMSEPERFPPTKDALKLHMMRCNYQVYEWKKAFDVNHIPNEPVGSGWDKKNDKLEIKWMTRKPAPEEILEFTSCSCKKSSCSSNRCQCFALNMKCVGLFSCRNCTNVEEVESEDEVSSSSGDESNEDTETDSEIEN